MHLRSTPKTCKTYAIWRLWTATSITLQSPNIIDDTINQYSSIDGLIKTKITPEEKLAAQELANQSIISQPNENKSLVKKAESRIKIILANYVKQLGDFSGIEYTIHWEKI